MLRKDFSSLGAVTFRFPVSLSPAARGDWTISIYLPPGRVVYHFDVDGGVWLNPNDDRRMRNAWGSEYSVRHVISTR